MGGGRREAKPRSLGMDDGESEGTPARQGVRHGHVAVPTGQRDGPPQERLRGRDTAETY